MDYFGLKMVADVELINSILLLIHSLQNLLPCKISAFWSFLGRFMGGSQDQVQSKTTLLDTVTPVSHLGLCWLTNGIKIYALRLFRPTFFFENFVEKIAKIERKFDFFCFLLLVKIVILLFTYANWTFYGMLQRV